MTKYIMLKPPKLTQIQRINVIQKSNLCWNSTSKLIIICFNEEYALVKSKDYDSSIGSCFMERLTNIEEG